MTITLVGLTYPAPARPHHKITQGRDASAKGPGSEIAMDVPAPDAEQALSMTSTSLPSHAFAYIETDVPAGQTLADWRREREAARRVEGRRRRIWHMPTLRLRWAS